MQWLPIFVSGVLFALGLGVAGMTDANKVIGFLDFTNGWDPSLAMVMVGAIAVNAVAYRLTVARGAPLFAEKFGIPTRRDITPRLVLGATLFGSGWAIGGFCPGPGLVSLASGALPPLIFVVTMSIGMRLAAWAEEAWDRRQVKAPVLERVDVKPNRQNVA